MKLTKQQLIKVIKEELNTLLQEYEGQESLNLLDRPRGPDSAPEGSDQPWPGYEQRMAELGTAIATMGDIYDTFPIADWAAGGPAGLPSPSWEEAHEADRARTQHAERERDYLENPPPWEHTAPSQHKYALRKAREAGETGWGPGSLEETIQLELASLIKELK
jgi:hypothetical protein